MKKAYLFMAVSFMFCVFTNVSAQGKMSAAEIIKKAEDKFKGEESSYGEMQVIIQRPTWKRTVTLKSWSKGNDFSLSVITAPANEKGQAFLKRKNELWTWNPTISRMIKLPPSMMSQGWMGSDYTNDDIMRESSMVNDYDVKLLGEEKCQGFDCYKIEMKPKASVAVVWGKIIIWISKGEYYQMKAEYFDEDSYLVRTMLSSNVKQFGDRKLPANMEILPADEPKNKTIVVILNMKFNQAVAESFFSQQNMKKVR